MSRAALGDGVSNDLTVQHPLSLPRLDERAECSLVSVHSACIDSHHSRSTSKRGLSDSETGMTAEFSWARSL